MAHYNGAYVVDGSTLDGLIRKIGLLKDLPNHPLAGRMTALLNLGSLLPTQIWYEEDPYAHDQRFWSQIQNALPVSALLIFDMGYINFTVFGELTLQNKRFITHAKDKFECLLSSSYMNYLYQLGVCGVTSKKTPDQSSS